jgi:hypothetical protein
MNSISECDHASRVVRKQNSAGHWMFTYQCSKCGDIDRGRIPTGGVWIPKSAVNDDLVLIPVFNEGLRESRLRQATLAMKQAREVEREEWWDEYDAYLSTPEWHEKREKALARDRYLCQGCLERQAVHVHHLTYQRLFHELICDLVSLCMECHQLCHPYKDISGRNWHGRPLSVH